MQGNWQEVNNTISNTFEFADFNEAIDFVNKVAEIAEKENHHPDILIHDYKKVTITLTTHSENKVTQKDHQLAEKIDNL